MVIEDRQHQLYLLELKSSYQRNILKCKEINIWDFIYEPPLFIPLSVISRLQYVCLLLSLHSSHSCRRNMIHFSGLRLVSWLISSISIPRILIIVYFFWSVMAINLTWDLPISSLKNFPIFLLLILINLLIFITFLQIDKKSRAESRNNKK